MGEHDTAEVEVLDKSLEKKNKSEFDQAMKALDTRGKRVVARLLDTRQVQRNPEGSEESGASVVSAGEITTITRSGSSEHVDDTGGEMREALEIAGIDATYLANVLREGLKAKKKVRVGPTLKAIPDYPTRIKYLELAHKLRGDVARTTSDSEGPRYEERIRLIIKENASR
jgi:hypothetical protein